MRKKRKLHLPQSKLLEERKKQTFKSSFTTKKQKNIHTLARKISKLALLKNKRQQVLLLSSKNLTFFKAQKV